jgi:hypothetical protein
MSDFEISFEWPVAKYEYQPGEPLDYSREAANIQQNRQRLKNMAIEKGQHFTNGLAVNISREEAEKHYGPLSQEEIEERLPLQPLGYLVRTSAAKMARPTPKAMKMAVRLLVERERTPLHKVALTIARAVGGLLPEEEREELENWDELADYLRGIFRGEHKDFLYYPDEIESKSSPLIGEMGIFLDRDKDGKLKFALRPSDLSNALILYAAQMATTGTTFNTCEHCRLPFLGGGTGRSPNKRRSDARFCSDECRYNYHNEMRRKTRKSKL